MITARQATPGTKVVLTSADAYSPAAVRILSIEVIRWESNWDGTANLIGRIWGTRSTPQHCGVFEAHDMIATSWAEAQAQQSR